MFLQAEGVSPVDPPPRALFELFFAPAPQSHLPLAFTWFERVRQLLPLGLRLVAPIARSFPLDIPPMRFVARMLLAVRSQLMSLCSPIMISPCGLPCRWALQFATSWHSRRPSARSQSLFLTLCWFCWVSLGLSVFRGFLCPTPRYLTNL